MRTPTPGPGMPALRLRRGKGAPESDADTKALNLILQKKGGLKQDRLAQQPRAGDPTLDAGARTHTVKDSAE